MDGLTSRWVRVARRGVATAAVALSLTTALPGAASAATCGTAEGFTRLSGGSLYRLKDPSVLTGENTLAETGLAGTGWSDFVWTGSGGDGVVYALSSTGVLRWYRYDFAASSWLAGGGTVIGSGFVPRRSLVNIAVGANGWIYVVQADGKLVLYQHTGRLTGAATWARPSGVVIGSGWTGQELLAPQGDGVIYRQYAGDLYWFRHSDPAAGPVTWAGAGRPTRIGTGWAFYDMLALGGGVLATTSAPSGQVAVFEHKDPANGKASWGTSGLDKYLARSDSFGVSLSPVTCQA